jgi:large subunit ribosomal protein L23
VILFKSIGRVRLEEKTEDKFSPSIGVAFTESNNAASLTSLAEQLRRNRNLTLQPKRKGGRFKGATSFRKWRVRNGVGVTSMMIELVKCPVVTEKSVQLLEKNQYTFDVDLKLTKPQIKQLIEELFQVKVMAVNTHRPPKKKRGRGYTTARKRAIITVKSGQSIPLFEMGMS